MSYTYFAYFPQVQTNLGLSGHGYTLAARVADTLRYDETAWYTAYPNETQGGFLGRVAKFVNNSFTPNGVENILKELAHQGIMELDVEFDPRKNKKNRKQIMNRLRPTAKFWNEINKAREEVGKQRDAKGTPSVFKPKFNTSSAAAAPTAYAQPMTVADLPLTDEDREEIAAIEAMFARCYEPAENTTIEAFKVDCETLVAETEAPEKQAKMTKVQQMFVVSIAKLLATKDAAAFLFFYNQCMARGREQRDRNQKARDQFKLLRGWAIDLEMTETEYINKLESTVIWLSTIRKHKLADDWTDADTQQLKQAIEFVGTDRNRKGGDRKAALEYFKAQKKPLIAQKQAEQAIKKAPVDAELAKLYAGTVKTVKDA